MKYAGFDQEGNIVGYYSPDIHKNIPSNTIKITDEQWQDCLQNQGRRKIDIKNKKIIIVEPSKPTEEQLLTEIRKIRNRKLRESDWMVLPDVPGTPEQKAARIKYRQDLRDFPATCDPYNPVWPEIPK